MSTPDRKLTLYALRHPEVADQDIDYDKCPLTPQGRAQARDVAAILRGLIPDNVRPLVLHQPRALRTIEEAEIIAHVFGVAFDQAGWLTDGPLGVDQLSRTEEYLEAGTVIACGGVPALRVLLRLAGIDPMDLSLPHGIVLKFEINVTDHTIRFVHVVS